MLQLPVSKQTGYQRQRHLAVAWRLVLRSPPLPTVPHDRLENYAYLPAKSQGLAY